MDILDVLRAILGGIFVLLAPGLVWSFLVFHGREVTWVERVVFSIALSVALVPISLFLANHYLSVSINLLNSFLIILVVVALPVPWLYLKQRLRH